MSSTRADRAEPIGSRLPGHRPFEPHADQQHPRNRSHDEIAGFQEAWQNESE